MNETQAIAKYKKMYSYCLFFKLHGGRFQSDLPDVICIRPNGTVVFLEFKCVDGLTLPWSKCRLGQHLTMLKMHNQGASVYYVVWSNKTEKFYSIWPDHVKENESYKLE